MKSLQNNFTTPEQSEILLKLGVPVDSADCRYEIAIYEGGVKQTYCVLGSPIHNNDIPCWSVGRLIDIYEICTGRYYERSSALVSVLIDIITDIEYRCEQKEIDFSKLRNKL